MAQVIKINIGKQNLSLIDGNRVIREYRISSARNGCGETDGSEMTPRGRHIIRAKIGTGCPPNTVFKGRRPTGEIYSSQLRRNYPDRDWILTRIIWLSGLEPGRNRLGDVDTMRRFIYIHGCPDDDPVGVPGSRGCIKMRNGDVIELFDSVPVGTPVDINE